MRVGSIGYATNQGLGILLKSFYDHGIVTDVLPVRHSKHPNMNWYGDYFTDTMNDAHDFAKAMDVMFFFETPFDSHLIRFCREQGIKTVLMPMYECTPDLRRIGEPDLILNPSALDQKYYPQGERCVVPVDIGWRQRTHANVFVHNAGHGGLRGRNGTAELIAAMEYVKSPIELILRCQNALQVIMVEDERIRYQIGDMPYSQLFTEGDVFVFPEKFNGLSLPLQEAYASGMLVIGTNRFPINDWLPNPPLIPVASYKKQRLVHHTFDEAVIDPRSIAAKIDECYGQDITLYSVSGGQFNLENCWNNLRHWYHERLEELCVSQSTS